MDDATGDRQHRLLLQQPTHDAPLCDGSLSSLITKTLAQSPGKSVAGHIHFFQAIDFGGVRPPQLVVGTGGDVLEALPPMSLVGADINGRKVVNSVTYSGFAYMVWDRIGNLWTGTLFDA